MDRFFEDEWPLQKLETQLRLRLDGQQRGRFTSIAGPKFHTRFGGNFNAVSMIELHGRVADGGWVTPVECCFRVHTEVRFGPIIPRTPPSTLLDALNTGCSLFAIHQHTCPAAAKTTARLNGESRGQGARPAVCRRIIQMKKIDMSDIDEQRLSVCGADTASGPCY